MEVAKGLNVDFKAGKLVAEYDLALVIVPALDKFKEDVESGAIDPVAGTDLDKVALLQAVEIVKNYLK